MNPLELGEEFVHEMVLGRLESGVGADSERSMFKLFINSVDL